MTDTPLDNTTLSILIVEEALQSPKGHWPDYIGRLADGLRKSGDQVTVLTHKDADPEVVKTVGGTPWMRHSCWTDPKSQGKLGGLLHNHYFKQDVRSFLSQSTTRYDWILFLTVRRQHLLGLKGIARFLKKNAPDTRILCLFVQGFAEYDPDTGKHSFSGSLNNRIAHWAFRRLRSELRQGRVALSAEANRMAEEISQFSGYEAACFPHPVSFDMVSTKTEALETTQTGQETFLLTCPGFARYEKGSDLLQEAVLRLLDEDPESPARFLIQWVDPFSLPDGSLCRPKEKLMNHPKVEFLDHPVDTHGYGAILRRTSAMVLPYRSEAYYARVSRVAIEAAFLGIPILYSKNTWNEDLVSGGLGAGHSIPALTVDGLVDGIRTLISNYQELKTEALRTAPMAQSFFSVNQFRNQLLNL